MGSKQDPFLHTTNLFITLVVCVLIRMTLGLRLATIAGMICGIAMVIVGPVELVSYLNQKKDENKVQPAN